MKTELGINYKSLNNTLCKVNKKKKFLATGKCQALLFSNSVLIKDYGKLTAVRS